MPDIPSTPDSPANGGRQLDQIDAMLALNRYTIINEALKAGKITPEEAGYLHARTTDRDVVDAERAALERGYFGSNDESTILGLLWLRSY